MSDRDALAELLAKHTYGAGSQGRFCRCGAMGTGDRYANHVAHLADLLAAREAEAGARALDEAAEQGPIGFAMTHEALRWRGYKHLVTTDWLRARAADLRDGGDQ